MGLESNVEDVFRRAQGAFTRWSELPAEERTTEALTRSLDFDFFRILDQVTVARSRRHIQRYYDAAAIGPFPQRNKPVSLRPDLCTEDGPATYDAIAERLYELELAIYVPMKYVQPSRKPKYEDGDGKISVEGREKGVQRLMAANLLKRLESSVASFRLTLERVLAHMDHTLEAIERFHTSGTSIPGDLLEDANGFDYDVDDEETSEFMVGKKARYDLRDMDWVSWERDIMADAQIVRDLLDLVAPIDPERDAKLAALKQVIASKVARPINAGNRKVIVFTAFADTAHYLYEQLRPLVVDELGLGMAEVTGAAGSKTTVDGVRADLSEILTCFSPVSKERDQVYPRLVGKRRGQQDHGGRRPRRPLGDPHVLQPRLQGARPGVPAPGGQGHRRPHRHGLHLRGPEPAGLRLPGQLRHPLEPRARGAALWPRGPHRLQERLHPAGQLLAQCRSTSGPMSSSTSTYSSRSASRTACTSLSWRRRATTITSTRTRRAILSTAVRSHGVDGRRRLPQREREGRS